MPEEQKKLRAYILGEIGGEKERQEIEERLMTDEDFFRELSLVEENVIQEYADGKLTAAERAKFEKCFLVSEENRQKVRFARALRKYVNETESPKSQTQKKPKFFDSLKSFFLSPVPVTLAVLIVLSVGGFWIWRSFSAARSESLVALNKAYRTERPLESRITDLDYAPTKNTRGAGDDDKTDKIKLALARETALRAVSENPSPENLHTLGRVYLAEKKFNDAIEQFEKAGKLAPDDAKLRSDLGAALLEKAKTMEDGKLETLAKANEEFAKAIDLNKNLTDAYFNQALTIQSLNLPNQAREAWQKYLELDSTSPWAEEARKNLERLETNKPISKTKEQILQGFLEAKQTGDREKAWQTLSRNREMITGKLIPQQLAFLFVDAKAGGDAAKAGEYLDALVFVGNLESEKSGDLYWKHIADYYSTDDAEKTIILKQAQDAVRKGYESCLANRYEQSETEFQKAADLFAKSKNTWEEYFAIYWVGYLLFLNNKVTASSQRLDRVVNFSQTGNYKWLLSQAFGWLAVNAASANKFSKSIEYDKKAVKYSEEVSESYNLQKILSQTAEHYQQVGQFTKALSYAQRGLEIGVHPEASLRQKWRDYDGVSDLFKVMKFYKTSELYKKEILRLALEELNDDVFKWMSYTGLASIYAAQNKYDEAFGLLNDSLEVIEKFENADGQRKRSAYIHLQKAHLYLLQKKYSEALANYEIAVNFYASAEYRVNEYEARKGKLMCYIAENNDPAFQQELPIVLDIFNKNRSDILEEQNRNSFFDNEQSIYDIAIDFESRKADFEKAFNYSEESRARSLLDLQNSFIEVSSDDNLPEIKLSSNVFQPLKLKQIQAEMSENVQFLEYSVLKDKILIWVISKNGFSLTESKIAEDLEKKVSRYSEIISKNIESEEQQSLSAEFYKILINPVKDKLDAGKEICIIPDKNLFLLPFATLKEEKYFIEDYIFFYAPSANVFLTSSKKAKSLSAEKFENLLSVGNPAFNRNAFENLSDLSSATREAIEVADFYDKPLIFTEKTATKKNFKDAFGKADVIHFAGHYVVNEHSPLLSSFVLAGNDKDDLSLANYEIITEKLNARLIILSACQTGVEKYYNGEGMIGAARTFLAMGVPLTVASQWQVDSDATAKLMTDFHRYRKTEGLSTVAALRKSQIEMLRSEKFQQPYFWAAFIALGGYSKI